MERRLELVKVFKLNSGKMRELILTIDGASRGNPGKAGVGITIEEVNNSHVVSVEEIKAFIGIATNNVAEYKALLLGLEKARDLYQGGKITILTDSQLLQYQIQGNYQTKNKHLKKLLSSVKEALTFFEEWQVNHIPREENKRAHRLAHEALK
jgi:ribonuclease HI